MGKDDDKRTPGEILFSFLEASADNARLSESEFKSLLPSEHRHSKEADDMYALYLRNGHDTLAQIQTEIDPTRSLMLPPVNGRSVGRTVELLDEIVDHLSSDIESLKADRKATLSECKRLAEQFRQLPKSVDLPDVTNMKDLLKVANDAT